MAGPVSFGSCRVVFDQIVFAVHGASLYVIQMDDIWMTNNDSKTRVKSTGFLGRFNNYGSAKIARMKKDNRLTFRVSSDLKKEVEAIATREGQSVARICEAFIMAGSDAYKKQGSKLLRRMLGELGTRTTD